MKTKVENIQVMKLSEAMALLNELRKTGKTFRIDFVKKSTGKVRTMVCRFGVTKHLTTPFGTRKRRVRPIDILTVYEWGVGYRSLGIDNIILIKKGNTAHLFTNLNNYEVSGIPAPIEFGTYNLKPQCIKAHTSLLFDHHLADELV